MVAIPALLLLLQAPSCWHTVPSTKWSSACVPAAKVDSVLAQRVALWRTNGGKTEYRVMQCKQVRPPFACPTVQLYSHKPRVTPPKVVVDHRKP